LVSRYGGQTGTERIGPVTLGCVAAGAQRAAVEVEMRRMDDGVVVSGDGDGDGEGGEV
jgi:hypothetical protein